jgi:hypothetical protein
MLLARERSTRWGTQTLGSEYQCQKQDNQNQSHIVLCDETGSLATATAQCCGTYNEVLPDVRHGVTASFTLCPASFRSSPAFFNPAFAWSALPLFSRSRLPVMVPAASLTRPLVSWALFDALSLVLTSCSSAWWLCRCVRAANDPDSHQSAPRRVINAVKAAYTTDGQALIGARWTLCETADSRGQGRVRPRVSHNLRRITNATVFPAGVPTPTSSASGSSGTAKGTDYPSVASA